MSEYLAAARDVETAIITTRGVFVQRAASSGLEVAVLFVGDHPWSQPGSLDAHPPTND